MKLTVGMGTIEQYFPYVEAGADEIFAGFVPQKWQHTGGLFMPLNRREVCYYNVQLGSETELKLLQSMVMECGVPVTLTMNSLYYRPEQYPLISEIMNDCAALGFKDFIIADLGLLLYLHEQKLTDAFTIHASGEFGELNRYTVRELCRLGVRRVIFHRKVNVSDMASLLSDANVFCGNTYAAPIEGEAFLMNELCHFTGAYCESLHCDELPPVCREPYRIGPVCSGEDIFQVKREKAVNRDSEQYVPGNSGCGLCMLPKLQTAGIGYLKIVGRGALTELQTQDLRAARKALELLDGSASEEDYLDALRIELFPYGCGGMCYYREGRRIYG